MFYFCSWYPQQPSQPLLVCKSQSRLNGNALITATETGIFGNLENACVFTHHPRLWPAALKDSSKFPKGKWITQTATLPQHRQTGVMKNLAMQWIWAITQMKNISLSWRWDCISVETESRCFYCRWSGKTLSFHFLVFVTCQLVKNEHETMRKRACLQNWCWSAAVGDGGQTLIPQHKWAVKA